MHATAAASDAGPGEGSIPLSPWGVHADTYPLPTYTQELRAFAARAPQLLGQVIEATSYLDLIRSALVVRPEAVRVLVERRRLERRWLLGHLGRREFRRRRRRGDFAHLFGWPAGGRADTAWGIRSQVPPVPAAADRGSRTDARG